MLLYNDRIGGKCRKSRAAPGRGHFFIKKSFKQSAYIQDLPCVAAHLRPLRGGSFAVRCRAARFARGGCRFAAAGQATSDKRNAQPLLRA